MADANDVGGSRQRVNRAWRQMQQLGIVQLGQARLVVLDAAALERGGRGPRRTRVRRSHGLRRSLNDQRAANAPITFARKRRMPRIQRS